MFPKLVTIFVSETFLLFYIFLELAGESDQQKRFLKSISCPLSVQNINPVFTLKQRKAITSNTMRMLRQKERKKNLKRQKTQ